MDISATEQALRQAATTALRAPSIFNSQPWLWHVDEHGGTPRLRLRVAASRQLAVADPDGRLMILSCGVALHHAQLALAAAGHKATVTVLPDPDDSDLLADITLGFSQTPSQDEIDLAEAIERRHTDRRPFTIQPVTDQLCRELVTCRRNPGRAPAHRACRPHRYPCAGGGAGRCLADQRPGPAHRAGQLDSPPAVER
jgi:hypothetical protein